MIKIFKKIALTLMVLALLAFVGIQIYRFKHTPETFSFVVLPDTQKYSEKNPKIFCDQTSWIATNKTNQNIRFVSHMGDIVENHNEFPAEWVAASNCMAILEKGGVPYGIIPGNHDTDTFYREDGMKTYDHYFPASRYTMYPWYKGNRKENQNNYQLISVATPEGMKKFLFLNLEIEPSNNTIAWANEIVSQYPNVYTILTTHKYLTDSGTGLDITRTYSRTGNTGQDIWNKLVKNNCSIRMVWNGHYHQTDGENMLITKNSCGEDVHQIIQDYQARESGGNGRLRIYTFNPKTDLINVKTYSPTTDTYETDTDSQFSVPFTY